MRIFVAGGSGTIGVPLVRSLVAAGHDVTALTRTAGKQVSLRRLGATPAMADALDRDALLRVVEAARPTHVIHQLTALPKEGDVKRVSDLEPTNKLRIEGTRNLLDAAIKVGARRFIGGSFAPLQDAAGVRRRGAVDAAAAVRSMESQILDASRRGAIEGLVLRYGLFYGPGNPVTQRMIALARRRMLPVIRGDRSLFPCIHLDDAVSATVAALSHGSPGSAYDIVDDRASSMSDIIRAVAEGAGAPKPFAIPFWVVRLFMPYMAMMMSTRLSLSNAKARAELNWAPAFPTIREGLAGILHAAA
jgi:nucleoside-diphosphate-sugar epimerase